MVTRVRPSGRIALALFVVLALGRAVPAYAEPSEVVDLNANPAAITADTDLAKIMADNHLRPLDRAAHATLPGFTENLRALVQTMTGPEDTARKVYVVLADDMRVNAGYVRVGTDRALVVVNLGVTRFVPDLHELGAIVGHELAHGPNSVEDYATSLRQKNPLLAAMVLRARENEADIRGALDRMQRARLNPHAMSSLLHRLREVHGDTGGATHTSFASRTDALGAAIAARVRLGLAPDSPYRLNERLRTRDWLAPLQDEWLHGDAFRRHQEARVQALLARQRDQIEERVQALLSVDVLPKAQADYAQGPDDRFFERVLETDLAELERIVGSGRSTVESYEQRLRVIRSLDEAMQTALRRFPPGYRPSDMSRYHLYLGFVARRKPLPMLGSFTGEYQYLPIIPFRLRHEIRELRAEIGRSRILLAASSEPEEREDIEQRIAQRERRLAGATAEYEAARVIYLERPTAHAVTEFDRRVDHTLDQIARHPQRQTDMPDWAQIDPIGWGFQPRVIDDLVRVSTTRVQTLEQQNRDFILDPSYNISHVFAPVPMEAIRRYFTGAEGAKRFAELFLRMVETRMTSTDDLQRAYDLRDVTAHRRGTTGNGWMSFFEQACRAPGFDGPDWLRRLLAALEGGTRTVADLNAIQKLVQDMLAEESGGWTPNLRRIALLEQARDRIAARDRLPLVRYSIARADQPRALYEALGHLNRGLRAETGDPSAEHARRIEELVTITARRLRVLTRFTQPGMTQPEAEALVWLKIPASLRRHPRAAELRTEVAARYREFAAKLRQHRNGANIHPYLLVQPYLFNDFVEWFTGNFQALPTAGVMELVREAPSLVSADWHSDEEVDHARGERINRDRLAWIERHFPNDYHAASRAARSMAYYEHALTPRITTVLGNWVGARLASHTDPLRALNEGVRDLIIEESRSFTQEGSYFTFESAVQTRVKAGYFDGVTDPNLYRQRLLAYLRGVEAGMDVSDPRPPRRAAPPGEDDFNAMLGFALAERGRPEKFGRFVTQDILEGALPASETTVSDAGVRDLIEILRIALQRVPSTPELDLLFDRVWRLTEGREHLRAPLRDESLVGTFFFAENRLRLARWQLESQFSIAARAGSLRSGAEELPRLGTMRPVVQAVGEKIARQFPERSSLRNALIHEVQDQLLTNDRETDHLQGIGVDFHNWQASSDLAFIDLPQQLSQGAETPAERLRLIEYFLGIRNQPPALKLERLPAKLKDRLRPGDVDRLVVASRQAFVDASRPVRAYVIQALLGDGDGGVLGNPRSHEQVLRLVLGDHADYEIPRKFLSTYLEVVPASEKKFILSFILASFVESSTKQASLKTILEALGPMGIYAGQFLRTSSALPTHVRAELDEFFNRALSPYRHEIIRMLRESFGAHFVDLVSIGELRGSGKINATVRVRLRSPRTGEVRTVTVRLLKDNVAEQSQAEHLVLDETMRRLSGPAHSPEIRRMARVGRDALGHAYAAIGPGGSELDHSQERAMLVEGGVVRRAYERAVDRDGVRVDVVHVDNEFQGLIVAGRQHRATVFEDIEHTPLWEIESPVERAFWAKKIVEAERTALLTRGLFDPDGHPGNWLIDRRNRRLVRIDIGQFRVLSAPDHRAVREVFEFLATERPTDAGIDRVVRNFSKLFTTSSSPANLADVVRWMLRHPDLPPHTAPEDRLYFFQEQLERHYATRDPDFHVSLSALSRNALSALTRARMYGEHTGEAWIGEALVRALPWTAQARVSSGGSRWVDTMTRAVDYCVGALTGW